MLHILTSAYNSARFTAEHVASMTAQKKPYKHLVCVDGCKDTLEAFKANLHPNMELYYSPQNMGKGLIINSLAADLPDEIPILIFDSDDYLHPKTLEVLPDLKGNEVYRLPFMNSPGNCKVHHAHGVMYLKAGTFKEIGGYRTDFRCAIDTDFFRRYNLYFEDAEEKTLHFKYYFQRNRHSNSLTVSKQTGMGSEYRNRAWEVMQQDVKKGKLKIDYYYTDIERIL